MTRRQKSTGSLQRLLTIYIVVAGIVVVAIVFHLIRQEVENSTYQARYLSEIGRQLGYKLTAGSNPSVRYPLVGPYDERLGYTLLPQAIKNLQDEGYAIAAQATLSPKMLELMDYGLFSIYHEKNQAGLHILDQADQPVFKAVYPVHGYANFDSIPPVILKTLLFIENRELFNEQKTYVNPAVEWDRLGFASLQLMVSKLGIGGNVPGGSTLATQIEKYRHSPEGFTHSLLDKFRQMGSASVRAYMEGPDTRAMRREIALAYLNSMPLAAVPKVGEVHGLGDGLSAWFGADFEEVNRLLNAGLLANSKVTPQQGQAFRQVLNILLSQRRPSYLLGKGYDGLQALTDSHLRILAEQGIISKPLRNAALSANSVRPPRAAAAGTYKFASEQKTPMVLRSRLGRILGIKSNYELDRLDLTVKTTLDYRTQQAVGLALRQLGEPANARAAGLLGKRMLDENTKLAPIVYSLMLYERSLGGNLLRVQTDNYDQPLDINEGIRIDLGSTAKLRTMVHYLELIADLYQQYHGYNTQQFNALKLHPRDHLSLWVVGQLRGNPRASLESLLMQALERQYSASPAESFFTGGGVHTFSNFTSNENGAVMSVRNALRDSVNLVFIRLMRDVVNHHLYKPNGIARWLDNPDDPKREDYLKHFADTEGSVYLRRFYAVYHTKTPEEALEHLAQRVMAKAPRLTMLYRAINPDSDEQGLQQFLTTYLGKEALEGEDLYSLYDNYSAQKFDLQDQGYITKIHPLELWLVGYLAKHPKASYGEIIEASAGQRQEVYRWLLKSNKMNAQQQRILTLLEAEAFRDIHHAWERVGYPFGGLTASYATAIGASGDRPAALAELVGIIRNDGLKLPSVRFENLHFAQATPYETIMNKLPEQGERIFAPEVARAARSAMIGVVHGGTASRLDGVFVDAAGKPMEVGGKTGTGDHRKEVWGKGGHLIESKFISRAAVFTFFLGEQYYGVITAYVSGEDAGRYHFTSSLPVQILRSLKPVLTPLLNKTAVPQEQPVATELAKTNLPAGKVVSQAPISAKPTPKALHKTTPRLPVVDAAKPGLVTSKPMETISPTTPLKPVNPMLTKAIARPIVPAIKNTAKETIQKPSHPVPPPATVHDQTATPPTPPKAGNINKQTLVQPLKEPLKAMAPIAKSPSVNEKPKLASKPVVDSMPVDAPDQAVTPLPERPVTPKPQPKVNNFNKPMPVVKGAVGDASKTIAPLPTSGALAQSPEKPKSPSSNARSNKPKTADKQNSATRYYKYPDSPITIPPATAPTPAPQ